MSEFEGFEMSSWDLTRPEWEPATTKLELGTAIIWLSDGEADYEQLFIPSVTYGRGIALAVSLREFRFFDTRSPRNVPSRTSSLRFDAFRWVPDRVMQATALMQAKCGGRCDRDLDCVDAACRCIRKSCRRK